MEVDGVKGYGLPIRGLAKCRRGPRQRMAIRPIPVGRQIESSQHPDHGRASASLHISIQNAHARRTSRKRTLGAQSRRTLMTDVLCALQQLDQATRRSGATSARAFRVATRQATSACCRCWDLRRPVRSSPAYTIACATLADENAITSGFTSRSKSRYAILMSS